MFTMVNRGGSDRRPGLRFVDHRGARRGARHLCRSLPDRVRSANHYPGGDAHVLAAKCGGEVRSFRLQRESSPGRQVARRQRGALDLQRARRTPSLRPSLRYRDAFVHCRRRSGARACAPVAPRMRTAHWRRRRCKYRVQGSGRRRAVGPRGEDHLARRQNLVVSGFSWKTSSSAPVPAASSPPSRAWRRC